MKAARVLQLAFAVVLLGGGGYLIWHFTGRPDLDDIYNWWNTTDFTDVLGNWTDDMDFGSFFDKDPFVGDNTTNNWKTDGTGGLKLVMLDALNDEWQTEFKNAISDWENGDPDTLTLTIEKGEVDNDCKVKDGLMKVCNGNYGNTGWLGINEMILSGGKIQSSVAKMNEYYLHNADIYKRQYTMCHEIGHGFGLPHTDEQFDNADLGNCLDYTNNPRVNLHPDASNFNRLVELYGVVPKNRILRSNGKEPETKSFSADLMRRYESAMAELEGFRMSQVDDEQRTGWRRLREHAHGGYFARRLDEEYTLKVQMLYAGPMN